MALMLNAIRLICCIASSLHVCIASSLHRFIASLLHCTGNCRMSQASCKMLERLSFSVLLLIFDLDEQQSILQCFASLAASVRLYITALESDECRMQAASY
jgi:hypothetical protein